MNTSEAIKNLETMSNALEKAANSPKHYNTDFAYYLEKMSWEMYKQAGALKDLETTFGISALNSIDV